MATKAEVLTSTGTTTGSFLKGIKARLAEGYSDWVRKGQLGDGGRAYARATGARI